LKPITLLLIFLVFVDYSFTQDKKSVEALYITNPLEIDGFLIEPVYNEIAPAKNFVQRLPYNGQPSFQPSEVYFFYDQNAIYVGAMLFDSSPDSIFNLLSERDQLGMSDYFGIYIDPYNEGQLAYGFFITPAGVQSDRKSTKRNRNVNRRLALEKEKIWDAVWESKTRISGKGWIVEMRIPYAALRFPEKEESTWGLNIFRSIQRYNSQSSWNFIDENVSGFIHQEGELTGIKDITPPIRLSISPYASAYQEYRGSSSDFIYKGGMDLKYGISESFTLDMMLIPDFGQIQSDDQRLNLSPYEIYFSEKRQFFTEGTELFDRAAIFYSRRIGAHPKFSDNASNSLSKTEVIDYNPNETQLANATKISGRTVKGWGIGLLNAITLPAYAILKDTITEDTRKIQTQPLTNYNVTIIDKSLKNNSYMSLINSNLSMANNPFFANVTATDFQFRDKSKTYALTGSGGISTRNENENETGYAAMLGLEKNSGKIQFGLSQRIYSDKYNINDVGYLKRNNEVTTRSYVSYNDIEPSGIFRQWNANISWNYIRMYNPNDFYTSGIDFMAAALFKNNYSIWFDVGLTTYTHDYYETRVAGRYYLTPFSNWGYLGVGSDERKKLNFYLESGTENQPSIDNYSYYVYGKFDLRAGQRFSFSYSISFGNGINEKGYVGRTDNNDTIYFSKRDVSTISNVFSSTVGFNKKTSIRFRLRYYWSGVLNNTYYQLQQDGTLEEDPSYSYKNDNNYNAFNIDMIFRWIFAPGSELSIAWKNAIYQSGDIFNSNYFENLGNTWKSEQINSISLKILYYIDYNYLKKK